MVLVFTSAKPVIKPEKIRLWSDLSFILEFTDIFKILIIMR
jgi:hypothetical protein